MAVEQFVAHRCRQHAQDRGIGERGVGEVRGSQVGAQSGQVRSHQGQVVVLDEDPATLGGDLGHALGEELVELAVGVPRLGQMAIGPGTAGRIEEVVVAEPQHGVGHHVVGHVVDVGLRLHQFDPQTVVGHQPRRHRLAVGPAHGRRHPGGSGAYHHGAEGSGQPARRFAHHREAIFEVEGQRSPVGDEHGVGQRAVSVQLATVDTHGATLPVGFATNQMTAGPGRIGRRGLTS